MMRFLRRRRWWWCYAVVVLSVGVTNAVFGKSGALAVGIPAKTLARPWHLSHADAKGERGVWIAVNSGYCYGEGRPHIDHVKVVERGIPGGHGQGRAIITVFEHYPSSRNAEGLCRDLGLTLRKFVQLRRPVIKLTLYDGSSHPPRLVTRRTSG